MFEPEEGSIMDPYLFTGKPRKPQYQNDEIKRINAERKLIVARTRLNRVSPRKQSSFTPVVGIFKTFSKVTSPEYQLSKTNRQIRHIETKEKLIDARERYENKARAYKEAHPSFISRLVRKHEEAQRAKRNVYTRKEGNSLPKYEE